MGSCPSLELNNSKNGFIFTRYMGCFYSFWSYFNSESGVKILGTDMILVQDNSYVGVILTPQYLGSFFLLKKSSLNSFLGLK